MHGVVPVQRIEFPYEKNLLALAVLCALTSGAAFAQTAEGPWLIRARAVNLDSSNKDSTGLGLSINDKTLPEVDISYFFNRNIAAELVLTVPQKQRLSSSALNAQIGTLKHLPPSLMLQYHFDTAGFRPYVGAGVNYTRFSSVRLPAGVSIDKSRLGRRPAGRRGHSAHQEPGPELRREEGLYPDRRGRSGRQAGHVQDRSDPGRRGPGLAVLTAGRGFGH